MFTGKSVDEEGLYRFLSRWALFGALAEVGLVVMMMAVVMPAAQGSGLSDDFLELIAASKIPSLYRLTMVLDASVWVALGGLLVGYAILLSKYQPLKSMLVASCGIAQVSGFTGALIRLEGTTRLAGNTLSAASSQQVGILQAYLNLQTIFNAHFDSGLLYAIAFLLLATSAWRMSEIPRWLALMLGLAGLFNLANDSLALAGSGYQFMLFFLALLAEILTFIGTGLVFWRAPQTQRISEVEELHVSTGG